MAALLLAPLLLAAASSSDDVCLGMDQGGWVQSSSGSSGDSSGSSGNRRELASAASGSGGDAPEEHCLVQPVYVDGSGESVLELFHEKAPDKKSPFFKPGAYINKLVGAYLNTTEYPKGVPNEYLCRVADMDSMEPGGLRHLIATQWVPRAQNKCFDLTRRRRAHTWVAATCAADVGIAASAQREARCKNSVCAPQVPQWCPRLGVSIVVAGVGSVIKIITIIIIMMMIMNKLLSTLKN